MKKFLCVILAVLMIIIPLNMGVFALETTSEGEKYPFVYIKGMNPNDLFLDYGTENQQRAINISDSSGLVSAAFKGLWGYFTKGTGDALAEPIVSYANKALGNLAGDKNGDSAHNVSLPKYPLALSNYPNFVNSLYSYPYGEPGVVLTAVEKYGADSVYYFSYDWRRSPLELADDLQELIDRAKADHNTDKVNLYSHSMGGVVHSSYVYKYGHEDLNSSITFASAFYGAAFVSDLFQGKLLISGDILAMVGEHNGGGFLLKAADRLGILDAFAKVAMNLIDLIKDNVYENFFRDVIATSPGFWSAVPKGDFDDCIEYVFPTQELKEEYGGLLEKIYELKDMRDGLDEAMWKLVENDVKVAVVASYDLPIMPFFESGYGQGDGTIDSASMLGGATVSNFRETLGDDYIPANADKLSPDRCVDMSDALFPNYTWVLKGAPHGSGSYGTEVNELLFWLIDFEGQPDVYSNSKYPQFTKSGRDERVELF